MMLTLAGIARLERQNISARIKKGMTQMQMSKFFEIPLNTIKKWDAEISGPSPWVRKLIIEKFERLNEGSKMKKEIAALQVSSLTLWNGILELDQHIEEEQALWSRLSPAEQQRIEHNLSILGAYHSNALEGNPMTLEEVKEQLGWEHG